MQYLLPTDFKLTDVAAGVLEQNISAEEEAFPPLPRTLLTLWNRNEVNENWPRFFPMIDEAATYRCYPDQPIVLRALRSDLGVHRVWGTAFGEALVFVLPKEFETALADRALSQPSVNILTSLDLKYTQPVFLWTAVLDGIAHSFMIDESAIYDFVELNSGGGTQSVVWVPTVFVAGDTVLSSGFWFDLPLEGQMHGGDFHCINYRPKRLYDDDELARAKSNAELAGSITPWEVRWWVDANGSKLAMVSMISLPGYVENNQ